MTTPETRPHRRGESAPVWGIFLVFLGVVLLLQTLNILPWGLWGTLWRFWPIIIVLIGIAILLRNFNVWLVSLLVALVLGGVLGLAVWRYGVLATGITAYYTRSLDNYTSAQVAVDFSAGTVKVDSLTGGSPNLVEASSEKIDNLDTMSVDFQQSGREARLNFKSVNLQAIGSAGINWEIRFARTIPLMLSLKAAASNADFHLNDLKVQELQLDVNAGNARVEMPASAGTTMASINANVANVEIGIPNGVAARIQVKSGLSAVQIDTNRFPLKGNYYLSPDYDTAPNRLDIEIETNVGRVSVS